MKNKYIKYLVIIIIVLAFILIFQVNNNKEINTSTNISNNISINKIQNIKNDVYIQSHKGYNYEIKGIVKNGTSKTVENLEISVDIYDKNNNKIRNMKAWLESLKAGENWAFSVWTGETNYIYKNLKVTYKK